MSHALGNGELINASHLLSSNGGLGVVAENIPSTGDNGAAYSFPSLVFPDDNGKEIRGFITTPPSVISGTGTIVNFFANEDTSFQLTVTDDCTVSWTWDLYVDGVLDTSGLTATVVIGATNNISTINITEENDVCQINSVNKLSSFIIVSEQNDSPLIQSANKISSNIDILDAEDTAQINSQNKLIIQALVGEQNDLIVVSGQTISDSSIIIVESDDQASIQSINKISSSIIVNEENDTAVLSSGFQFAGNITHTEQNDNLNSNAILKNVAGINKNEEPDLSNIEARIKIESLITIMEDNDSIQSNAITGLSSEIDITENNDVMLASSGDPMFFGQFNVVEQDDIAFQSGFSKTNANISIVEDADVSTISSNSESLAGIINVQEFNDTTNSTGSLFIPNDITITEQNDFPNISSSIKNIGGLEITEILDTANILQEQETVDILIVQDSSGAVVDANSYCTYDFILKYFSKRGVDISSFENIDVQTALIISTDYIDSFYGEKFKGYVENKEQTTKWPRKSVFACGFDYSEEIPLQIKKACCEYALIELNGGDLVAEFDYADNGQNIKSESVVIGPIKETIVYKDDYQKNIKRLYIKGDKLIEKFLDASLTTNYLLRG